MNRFNLRAHHLMCCYTFTGVGYNRAFTRNMTCVVSALYSPEPLEITLLNGCDDLCRRCPHNLGGVCETEESVLLRDKDIVDFFNLKNKAKLMAQDLQAILEKQKTLGSIRDICRDCTFTELCEEVLKQKNML